MPVISAKERMIKSGAMNWGRAVETAGQGRVEERK